MPSTGSPTPAEWEIPLVVHARRVQGHMYTLPSLPDSGAGVESSIPPLPCTCSWRSKGARSGFRNVGPAKDRTGGSPPDLLAPTFAGLGS